MFTEIVLTTMIVGSLNAALHNFADIECGKTPVKTQFRTGRIVGGEEATQGEFPWLVSITRRGGHFCGGTVINRKYVLTAGHCVCSGIGNEILDPTHIKLSLAQHSLVESSGVTYQVAVKTILPHEEYKCNKVRNDIAILELELPLEWSDNVAPACLPVGVNDVSYEVVKNVLATVAGWGWTNENSHKGGRAKLLQKARVEVLENDKCREWYKSQGKKTKIQESQLCAGFEQGGVDSCWADSGGPLMINTDNTQSTVIGIVSTGIGCARPYLPGLYTRISEYIPWIESIVKH